MSDKSKIEWTEATWNPVVGCTRVSAGCDHCYAVKQSYRLERMGQERYAGLTVLNKRGDRHFNGVVRCVEEALDKPLRDWFACPITLKKGLVGAKPPAVCRWLFEVLGAEPTDDLHDIYPGTGIVAATWEAWKSDVLATHPAGDTDNERR